MTAVLSETHYDRQTQSFEPGPPEEPETAQDHRVTVLISMSEKDAEVLRNAADVHGVTLSYRSFRLFDNARTSAPVEIIAIGSLPNLTELPPLQDSGCDCK